MQQTSQTFSKVHRKIAEISEGDVLAFKNAGAYCFTMASNYNSRFRPAEVLWHEGTAHVIRSQENFEDLHNAIQQHPLLILRHFVQPDQLRLTNLQQHLLAFQILLPLEVLLPLLCQQLR